MGRISAAMGVPRTTLFVMLIGLVAIGCADQLIDRVKVCGLSTIEPGTEDDFLNLQYAATVEETQGCLGWCPDEPETEELPLAFYSTGAPAGRKTSNCFTLYCAEAYDDDDADISSDNSNVMHSHNVLRALDDLEGYVTPYALHDDVLVYSVTWTLRSHTSSSTSLEATIESQEIEDNVLKVSVAF